MQATQTVFAAPQCVNPFVQLKEAFTEVVLQMEPVGAIPTPEDNPVAECQGNTPEQVEGV